MRAARWSGRGFTVRAKMKMFSGNTSLVPRMIASSPSYFSQQNTEAVSCNGSLDCHILSYAAQLHTQYIRESSPSVHYWCCEAPILRILRGILY